MMGEQHHTGKQNEMHYHHRHRHLHFQRCDLRRRVAQMLAKKESRDGGIEHHRGRSLPSEGGEHEGAVPLPGFRHHQHWRRRKIGQRSSDGDVDEQNAKCEVLQSLRHPFLKDSRSQHQRRDRHRRRLGDERTEQRRCCQTQPCAG